MPSWPSVVIVAACRAGWQCAVAMCSDGKLLLFCATAARIARSTSRAVAPAARSRCSCLAAHGSLCAQLHLPSFLLLRRLCNLAAPVGPVVQDLEQHDTIDCRAEHKAPHHGRAGAFAHACEDAHKRASKHERRCDDAQLACLTLHNIFNSLLSQSTA